MHPMPDPSSPLDHSYSAKHATPEPQTVVVQPLTELQRRSISTQTAQPHASPENTTIINMSKSDEMAAMQKRIDELEKSEKVSQK